MVIPLGTVTSFRNCHFNLPLVLFTYCIYYIQCIDSLSIFLFYMLTQVQAK